MTKKKKRRRRRPAAPKPAAQTPEVVETDEAEEGVDDAEPEDTRRRLAAPSPYPSLGVSVAKGMRSVGAHPITLSTAFLSLLATWGAFAALGAAVSPRFLAVLMSVSPSHLFSDIPVALGAAESVPAGLLATIGIVALRAVTFGLLMLFQVQAIRDGRPDRRAAMAALPRVGLRLVAIYTFEAAVVVFAQQLVTSFIPQFGILVLAAAMYFLVFPSVVAVAEDAPAQEALRRGFRAVRLPGTRHLSFVLGYFLVFIYAATVSPFGLFAPATPSVAAWAFALVVTFVHASVLGAFVYRWLEVRDRVPGGPAGRTR